MISSVEGKRLDSKDGSLCSDTSSPRNKLIVNAWHWNAVCTFESTKPGNKSTLFPGLTSGFCIFEGQKYNEVQVRSR
jgi:hypothetical protein